MATSDVNQQRADKITAGCLALTNGRRSKIDNGKIVRVEFLAPEQEFTFEGDVYTAWRKRSWVVRSLGTPFLDIPPNTQPMTHRYLESALIPLGKEPVPSVDIQREEVSHD